MSEDKVLNLGQEEMAKYPFLADTGNYLREMGFTPVQFAADPDLHGFVEMACKRIETAADGKIYNSGPEINLDGDVFSFVISIIVLKLVGANTLISRFALAEARRAEKFLENDFKNKNDSAKELLAKRIIKELFGVEITKSDDDYLMHVKDYVPHAVNFHEREWQLVNRRVHKGYVYLTLHEAVRLIRRALTNYIFQKIQSAKSPGEIPEYSPFVQRITKLATKFSVPTAMSSEYPPCVKHAIEVMEKGENLPHSGRFMLATYLLARGQTVEQIAPLFKNAPDYNERVTLYQLNNLAGSTKGGEKYACPGCDKLKSQSLCYADEKCLNIKSPLQYGRKKK